MERFQPITCFTLEGSMSTPIVGSRHPTKDIDHVLFQCIKAKEFWEKVRRHNGITYTLISRVRTTRISMNAGSKSGTKTIHNG